MVLPPRPLVRCESPAPVSCSERAAAPQPPGASVGICDETVERPRPGGLPPAHGVGPMPSRLPRWSRAATVSLVPAVECCSRIAPELHSLVNVEQVGVAGGAAEVLTPHLQA